MALIIRIGNFKRSLNFESSLTLHFHQGWQCNSYTITFIRRWQEQFDWALLSVVNMTDSQKAVSITVQLYTSIYNPSPKPGEVHEWPVVTSSVDCKFTLGSTLEIIGAPKSEGLNKFRNERHSGSPIVTVLKGENSKFIPTVRDARATRSLWHCMWPVLFIPD